MSFLKKMFAKKDPVEEMRQFHANQDWAAVLSTALKIDRSLLDDERQDQVTAWEETAGDALAAINLEEGGWAQKAGNLLRAREDYQLAGELARSSALRKRSQQALASLDRGVTPQVSEASEDGPASHAGCSNSCSTTPESNEAAEEQSLDDEVRLELLLATIPKELGARYMAAGPEFRQAWLTAQDGDTEQALALFNRVPEAERNSLFLFERGALMARKGQHKKASQDLQAALTAEPDLLPAFETFADVLVAAGRIGELEKALKQNLAAGRFVGYCWARLAEVHARRGEGELALAAGLKALDEGLMDQELIALCAQLLDQAERFDEEEALLTQMKGGGCGGGAHPLLAEFWLRRGKNLNQALESFKAAMRQERDNPRWLLRISQVYLAKGWRKEAAEQIEQLMRQGDLPEQIRAEVQAMASKLQQS